MHKKGIYFLLAGIVSALPLTVSTGAETRAPAAVSGPETAAVTVDAVAANRPPKLSKLKKSQLTPAMLLPELNNMPAKNTVTQRDSRMAPAPTASPENTTTVARPCSPSAIRETVLRFTPSAPKPQAEATAFPGNNPPRFSYLKEGQRTPANVEVSESTASEPASIPADSSPAAGKPDEPPPAVSAVKENAASVGPTAAKASPDNTGKDGQSGVFPEKTASAKAMQAGGTGKFSTLSSDERTPAMTLPELNTPTPQKPAPVAERRVYIRIPQPGTGKAAETETASCPPVAGKALPGAPAGGDPANESRQAAGSERIFVQIPKPGAGKPITSSVVSKDAGQQLTITPKNAGAGSGEKTVLSQAPAAAISDLVTAGAPAHADKSKQQAVREIPSRNHVRKAKPNPALYNRRGSDAKFNAARDAYSKGDKARLEELAQQLNDHPLHDYVQLWQILLDVKKDHSQSADKSLERFIAAHEGQYLSERARTDWARIAAENEQGDRFLSLWPRILWNQNEKDMRCHHAYFLLKKKTSSESIAAAEEALRLEGGKPCNACSRLSRTLLEAAPGMLWERVLVLAQQSRSREARTLVLAADAGTLGADPREMAAILSNPEKWYSANEKQLSGKNERVLAIAAIALAGKNEKAAADAAAAAGNRLSPQTRAVVWGRIGLLAARRHSENALSYYRKAGKLLGSGSYCVDGEDELAWQMRSAILFGNATEQLRAASMLSREQKEAPEWRYWRAKSLAASGNEQEAEKIFRKLSLSANFYGLLSCDTLGTGYPALPEHITPPATQESFDEFDRCGDLLRARRFYEMDSYYEGNREWNWYMRRLGTRKRLELAAWAEALGIYHRAVSTSGSTGISILPLAYPRVYLTEIEQASAGVELPVNWLFGLILQESRFIPAAKSSAGARGAMQIMPSTARWIAKKMGMGTFRTSQLHDLQTNLSMGAYYLKAVSNALDGSLPLAAAAYNAGPNRAQRWRARMPREVEAAAFIENIPFDETRGYVRNVSANAVNYSRYYREKPENLSSLIGRISPEPTKKLSLP